MGIGNKRNKKMHSKDGPFEEKKVHRNILKFTGVNPTSDELQDRFCHQVIMNPLTELALAHLPSVLSIVIEKNLEISSDGSDT